MTFQKISNSVVPHLGFSIMKFIHSFKNICQVEIIELQNLSDEIRSNLGTAKYRPQELEGKLIVFVLIKCIMKTRKTIISAVG